MSTPQDPHGVPEKVQSASSAAYPLQLVLLLIVAAIASFLYFYLTSGNDEGGGSIRGHVEQTVARTA